MKVLSEYVLYDCLVERIVQSFFAPNERYAKKQVNLFFEKNSDCDRKDFKLYIYDSLNVPENYDDLKSVEEVNIDEA